MREILPIQQTDNPILANYINIIAKSVGDVIYFNWTLYNNTTYNNTTYINNGSICIFGEDLDLYNIDNEFMWEYVGVQLKLIYIE